jgi:hypothetical protein
MFSLSEVSILKSLPKIRLTHKFSECGFKRPARPIICGVISYRHTAYAMYVATVGNHQPSRLKCQRVAY